MCNKFYKLEKALKYVSGAPNRTIVGVDHVNLKTQTIVKHWLGFESAAEMLAYVQKMPPLKSHFYEVFLEDKILYEVYDIDINKNNDLNRDLTPKTAFNQFCAKYLQTMNSIGIEELPDFRVLDSSSPEKISLHITNKKRAFLSPYELKEWYRLFDPNLFDKRIARKNGMFRMLGSCKLGSTRVLKKAEWHAPSIDAPDSDFYVTQVGLDTILCDYVKECLEKQTKSNNNESESAKISRRPLAKVKPSTYIDKISRVMLEYIIDGIPQDHCQNSRERWIESVCICCDQGYPDLAHKMAQKSSRYNKKATDDMCEYALSNPSRKSFRTFIHYVKNSKSESEYNMFLKQMPRDHEIYYELTCANETVHMARVDIAQYLKSGKNTILIKSNLMTFKSTAIRQAIEEFRNKKILWVTNRVLLAKDIQTEKFPDVPFKMYNTNSIKEPNGCINAEKNPCLIMQLNSIYLIEDKYDLVILDEIESTQDIMVNFTNRKSECARAFRTLVKHAETVVACDATLKDKTCEVILGLRPNKSNIIVNNTYQSMKGRECIINTISDEGPFLDYIRKLLKQGARLVVPTNSKRIAKLVENLAKEILKESEIGAYYKGTEQCTVSDWRGKRIIIYSPSITTGLSFNDLWFDQIVAYFTNSSATAETSLQMLYRVRNTKNNVMQIFYNHKFHDFTKLALNEVDIENETLNNAELLSTGLIKKDIISAHIKRNWYYNLYEQNEISKNKSKLEHIPILRGLLTQHGVKTTVNKIESTEESTELRRKTREKLEELEDVEYANIANSELTDEETYDAICKKSSYSHITVEERRLLLKRYIHNVMNPSKWSPELIKLLCAKECKLVHLYQEAKTLVDHEKAGNLEEYLEQGHKSRVDYLEQIYKSCENEDYDEYIVNMLNTRHNHKKHQLVLGLIKAAGFRGFTDTRNISINYEALREYITSKDTLIKTIWPRSSINNLNNDQAIALYVNNRLKDCNFHIEKCSKNSKSNFSYKLRLTNHKMLKEHGIDVFT